MNHARTRNHQNTNPTRSCCTTRFSLNRINHLSRLCNGPRNFGQSDPLGSTACVAGINFSLYSREASGVELLLFDGEGDVQPARVINLDPVMNRTYHYWHVFVPGIEPGQIYGYRVHGPLNPRNGLRFDDQKTLLDPYGRGIIVPTNYSREAACKAGENTAAAMKSVVVDPTAYDWEGDTPLKTSSKRRSNAMLQGTSNTGTSARSCVTQSKSTSREPASKSASNTSIPAIPSEAYQRIRMTRPSACS